MLNYDYLLVVGPGRSGSEFLYENLKSHPQFAFPEIKEGYYYRSLSAFVRARECLADATPQILADIANLGYCDTALGSGIQTLQRVGYRVLVVVLLREHAARAVSMMRFRRSRGEFSAWRGRGRLETAVVADRLTPQHLQSVFGLQVDVLTCHFSVLVGATPVFLQCLAALCGTTAIPCIAQKRVNRSVQARSLPLSALGKLIAVALRAGGFRRLLQTLKDNPTLARLFFVPLASPDAERTLRPDHQRLLDDSFRQCCATVERHSRPVGENIYLKTANGPARGPG